MSQGGSGVARELLGSLSRELLVGVARVAQDVSQVCSGADLESLAGELLKIIAAELIQGCPEVARELLGRVARERCLGVAPGKCRGSWARVSRELIRVALGLLGSCSGDLLGGAAWELLRGFAREVIQGYSGVARKLLRASRGSCSQVARWSCSRVEPELLGSWVRAAGELLWGVAGEVTEGCSGVETELLGRISRDVLGS